MQSCSTDLEKYDAEHKTEYYQTLKTYLSCQMNAVKAELFILPQYFPVPDGTY